MRPATTFSHVIALLLAAVLVFAACGDDDLSETPTPTQADQADDPTTDDGTDQPTTDDGEGSGDDGGTSSDVQDAIDELDFGDGGAIVTIGDTTYEFALGGNSTVGNTTYIGVCQTLFGLIVAEGYDPEGRDITVSLEIPPEDWDTYEDERYGPPRVEVEDNSTGEFITWVADQSLRETFPDMAGVDQSRVDAWTTDGTTASGSATFIQEIFSTEGDGTPVQGTFQVGCAE